MPLLSRDVSFGKLALAIALSAPLAAASPQSRPASAPVCQRCGWHAAATRRNVRVTTIAELERAVAGAQPDTTILVADGDYRLNQMLDIAAPRVVIRGASGEPGRVFLHGAGMSERQVGVAVSVSAADVTLADLTIGLVGYHGIQVRGERGASRVTVHNVRIVDTGQQLIKGSTTGGPQYADDGVVACSLLEYSDQALSDYTNGIDVLAGNGWTVRDNTLRHIRGPASGEFAAGPAILFWGHSQHTRIERNTIVDSFRGIALGLGPRTGPDLGRDRESRLDAQDGWILQNAIVNLNAWADEGIEANAATAVRIDHNTVLTRGRLSWAISVRFPESSALVRNNLTSRPIILRNGGRAEMSGNVSGADRDWFVDAAAGDFRLTGRGGPAIDAGVPLPDVLEDMARRPRVVGRAPDAGALEYP